MRATPSGRPTRGEDLPGMQSLKWRMGAAGAGGGVSVEGDSMRAEGGELWGGAPEGGGWFGLAAEVARGIEHVEADVDEGAAAGLFLLREPAGADGDSARARPDGAGVI